MSSSGIWACGCRCMNSMQSFDIAVNDNCCLMTITTACSPPLNDSPPTDTVYISCQRWTRPMTSFIKTKTHGYRGLASSTVIVCSFVVHAVGLSPKSKVGLTVKTFIEIMRCGILNNIVLSVNFVFYTCSATTSKHQ